MKKYLTLTVLFLGTLLATLEIINLDISANAAKPVSSSYIKQNGIKHHFYILKKDVKSTLTYYVNIPGADQDALTKTGKVTIPKGTIIDSQFTERKHGKKILYGTGIDLSYVLKKKMLGKNRLVGGPTFALNNSSATVRIKRPAYLLPYGNNVLYSGGLAGFSKFKTYHSNVIKLTSDGYVEYYKYTNHRNLENVLSSYQKQTLPTDYAKINHSLIKENKIYLYYSHKLDGVADQQIHKNGQYKYRLIIQNLHTPYTIGNNFFASMYTVGNSQFYTFVTPSKG